MAESPRVQWRATDTVVARALQERIPTINQGNATISDVNERDSERFYKAVLPTLYAINLSYGEAMSIVDVLNGSLMTAELPHAIKGSIEFAVQHEGYAEKWEIDGPLFIKKMESWSPLDCLAIIDATERWWASSPSYRTEEQETHEQRCVRVGLIRAPRRELLSPQ